MKKIYLRSEIYLRNLKEKKLFEKKVANIAEIKNCKNLAEKWNFKKILFADAGIIFQK